MEKWILRNRNTNIENLNSLDISQNIFKILINRGFKNFDEINNYINVDFGILKNPFLLKDFGQTIEILKNIKNTNEKIRIVGDYDVDGIISVYVLYRTFLDIGLNVDFVIPDRIKEGYGINNKIVEEAVKDNVKVIITCDNGIAAIDVVKFAKDNGLIVIITDHHDIQMKINDDGQSVFVLPEADAILNPKQEDCKYEFKKLCGAGVCFKLCSELYKIFNMDYKIENLLQFVAIATVCDVVDLEDENRFIVKKGIELIGKTENVGLNAIIEANSLVKENISTYEIGFVIGPCLNALGRLENAKKGIELLLCDDYDKAYELALEIKKLNDLRKNMTVDGLNSCIKIIRENSYDKSKIIVVYNEDIHESIAGIIAGRIKEKYYKPVIVLTKGENICKGSARSIENINIFDLLSDNKSLLENFGGHPMAAGISIQEKFINELRDNLNSSDKIRTEDFENIVYIDMFLPIQNINYKFIKDLYFLEPFGKSNPKPIFGDKKVRICYLKRIGKDKNYISMKLISRDNKIFDFLYFGDADEFDQKFIDIYDKISLDKLYSGNYFMNSKFYIDVLYEVKIDNYNFNETIKYFLYKYRF